MISSTPSKIDPSESTMPHFPFTNPAETIDKDFGSIVAGNGSDGAMFFFVDFTIQNFPRVEVLP